MHIQSSRKASTVLSGHEHPNDPPPDRDFEECFVSSLGWGLHLNLDHDGRFELPISTALGLDPTAFHYTELRELFLAIRDTYLSDDAFTWPAAKMRLFERGWFSGGLGNVRWTVFLDIVTNRFMTVSALPQLRRDIEAHAKSLPGGYQ